LTPPYPGNTRGALWTENRWVINLSNHTLPAFLISALASPNPSGPWILNSEPADREEEAETSNFGMPMKEGLVLALLAYTLLENSMALLLLWTPTAVVYVAPEPFM
jgi:hypothetical protein